MTGNNYGFRFKDWPAYKEAREFRKKCKKIINGFPKEEKYSLTNQVSRALDSIILNIAEGANKSSDKDTRLYINRALCSLDEVIAGFDCALDDKYIGHNTVDETLKNAENLAKQLNKFQNYLKSVRD